jgi:hypothetical protein
MSNEGWGENSRIKWGSYSSLDPKLTSNPLFWSAKATTCTANFT